MAVMSEACVLGSSLVGIVGSNTVGAYGCLSVVSAVCCTGRGLCDWLITSPEESYQLCMCVCVCVCVCV